MDKTRRSLLGAISGLSALSVAAIPKDLFGEVKKSIPSLTYVELDYQVNKHFQDSSPTNFLSTHLVTFSRMHGFMPEQIAMFPPLYEGFIQETGNPDLAKGVWLFPGANPLPCYPDSSVPPGKMRLYYDVNKTLRG